MNNAFVTVIIPTYKDWSRLALCLDALSKQTFSKENFEIIVVNNHPSDRIPDNYLLPDNCIIISEKLPGSYAARNAAIKIAKGNILGFTDSDCIPDSSWIKNAVDYLKKHQNCSRIAGKIRLFFKSSKLTYVELYEKIFAFNQDIYVKMNGTGVTANMFIYKSVFDQVGEFNDNLMSGGDYEWNVRARDAGFKIEYAEEVVVEHPARFHMDELTNKAKRVGGGKASYGKTGSSKVRLFLSFLYDIRPSASIIKLIISKGKDLSLVQKATVFFIKYYINILTAYEKLNVQLGKKPNRA